MAGPRGVALAVTCTFLMLFGAGCMDKGGDEGTSGNTAPDATPFAGFTYPCLDSMTRHEDLCFGFLGDEHRVYGEPTVAVHPEDDSLAAIAAIVAPATPATPDATVAVPHVFDLEVYFTSDGGLTWSTSTLPLDRILANHPSGGKQIGQNVDPAMAFDAAGVLHFSGLVVPILGGNVPDVYYTSTADMGRTWTEPLFLTTDGKADRNWLSVLPDGVVYVTWARGPETASAAWSEDGGSKWTILPGEGVACFWFLTAPVRYGEQELSACTDDAAGGVVRLYAFDRLAGNASMVAERAGPVGRPYLARQGDRLLLAVDTPRETLLYRSENGTDAWSDPLDARQLLAGTEGWTWLRSRWVTTDPWGHVHLLFEGGSGCVNGCDRMTGEVLHLVLDENLSKRDERLLTPSDPDPPQDLVDLPPPDDYHGIAFGREEGYLAWTWDGRIAWSKVGLASDPEM